jgi:hypothetical protein
LVVIWPDLNPMAGGPAQIGEMKNNNPVAQNTEDASMDRSPFLLFFCVAILTPFPMTVPGGSFLVLFMLFSGEKS